MPPASPGTARARDQLFQALEPVVSGAGYDLEDVAVTSAGRRSLVRVVVDGDHGVDLDAVADLSRAISAALDDTTPGGALFAGPYVLEVSSPGVDRPLTEPRHWRRATGRLVQVSAGGAPLLGRIVSCDSTGVRLEVSGAVRALGWTDLGSGRIQVEFEHVSGASGPGGDDIDGDDIDDDDIDGDGDGDDIDDDGDGDDIDDDDDIDGDDDRALGDPADRDAED